MKYQVNGSLDGGQWGAISNAVRDAFDGPAALDAFLREKMGRSVVNRIHWGKAFGFVCNDLVSYCERNGQLGTLLTALSEERGELPGVRELLASLEASGKLTVAA